MSLANLWERIVSGTGIRESAPEVEVASRVPRLQADRKTVMYHSLIRFSHFLQQKPQIVASLRFRRVKLQSLPIVRDRGVNIASGLTLARYGNQLGSRGMFFRGGSRRVTAECFPDWIVARRLSGGW